jgi:L-alanine-DL-glutamate epimerase-like enolase superfamily enzyme
MIITDVECHLLTCPQRTWSGGPEYRSSSALVRITTDEGVDGLGDPLSAYHVPEAIPGLVQFFRHELVGEDPVRITHLWRKMQNACLFWGRTGPGMSVIAAIDNALWDLRAKMLGVPLYNLLGGIANPTVRAYATGAAATAPLSRTVEIARSYLSEGFTAFKFGTGYLGQPYGSTAIDRSVRQEVEKVAALREAVGPDVDIMIDGHQGAVARPWSRKTALAVAQALEPFRVAFFEEPLPFDDPDGYALLRRESGTPIAGGEGFMGIADFTRFFDADALDIAQPDVGYHGGITETLRIVASAEARNVRVVLHNPSMGGGVMFGLHLAFARYSCQLIELLPVRSALQEALLVEPIRIERGMIHPPQSPGAGLRWDRDLPKRFPYVPGSGERQGEG